MNKLGLFCGINSLGMPFPRENINHKGYYDIIKNYLLEQGYDVTGVNISSLNKNHTWDLERILLLGYSLSKIKNIQMKSIDDLRNTNFLFKLVVPKKFKKRYYPVLSDEQILFKDLYMKSENPIFIYSGGPNDFFTYIGAGPVEVMSEKIREGLPNNLEELIAKCVNNVEQNWILLHQLNPNVKIIALSFYYSPLFDIIQRIIFLQEKIKDRNKQYKNVFKDLIMLYNKLIESKAQNYEFVDYIDLSFVANYCAPFDFHPNTEGNILIANTIIESLNRQNTKSNLL